MELDRVKASMVQVKTIQDRDKRAQVNTDAAKRFVESGIWNPGEAKKRQNESSQNNSDAAATSTSQQVFQHKRQK